MVNRDVSNIQDETYFQVSNLTRFKAAYAELAFNLGMNYALTLAWNRDVPLSAAKGHLREMLARVDAAFLGRRFYRHPANERARAMFVFEKVETNIHVHGLWRMPSLKKIKLLGSLFPGERGGVWNEVVPSGSYCLTRIEDHHSAVGYMMKGQHMRSDDREMVWSDQWHSVGSRDGR